MMRKQKKNPERERCTSCEQELDPAKIVWLELSITDGNYYEHIPVCHQSQGAFPFGSACAKKQLRITEENTKAPECELRK